METTQEQDNTNTSENVQTDTGIVSENPITEDDLVNEEEQTNTVEQAEVNTNLDYQLLNQNGHFIVIGNVTSDQLSQVVSELAEQYGEDAVSDLMVFDYQTINAGLEAGVTSTLGDTGYTATKDENGNITIKDAEGNVIYNWGDQVTNDEQITDDNQEVEQNDDELQFADDIVIPEDYESKDFAVNSDEYLLFENADGTYVIAMGGVGLSNAQLQDLISRLQADGIIPADAQVTPGLLPSALDENDIEQGKTEEKAQIGDFIVTTKDGINYTVYTKDGQVLDTAIKDQDDQLGENHETSNNPDAEPGVKPGEDDINPNEPTEPGDKPGEDEPEPEPTPEPEPEPTPEPEPEPTPEPQPEPTPQPQPTPEKDLPYVGDPTALTAGASALGLGAAAAGAALKKRKKDKDDKGDRKLTLIDGGKPKTTYEDLENMFKEGKPINPHDYEDDLELFAKAWVLSKEQNSQEQTKSKGRVR